MMMLLQNSITGNVGDNDDDVDNNGVNYCRSNRMLYIQDRGVLRWDTCAAEAWLESYGGKLVKLTHFLNNMEMSTMTMKEEEEGEQ